MHQESLHGKGRKRERENREREIMDGAGVDVEEVLIEYISKCLIGFN